MKKITTYVFLFILFIIFILLINFINTYFSQRVKIYIDNKGVLYTQSYIKDAINNDIMNEIKLSSLYEIQKNDNQIESVIINTAQVNKILSLLQQSLEKNMENIQNEDLKISMSTILGDTLFSSIGPDIKIKIVPIGSFTCDVLTNATHYGINNTLFEIYIDIKLKIETIIPLQKSQNTVNCKIPIVMQIIQGDVPRYYYNTDKIIPEINDNNSNI